MGFSQVFTAPNNAVALRMFADTVRQPDTLLNQHAEDFELFFICKMDENTGEVTEKPTFLERATTFKELKNGN